MSLASGASTAERILAAPCRASSSLPGEQVARRGERIEAGQRSPPSPPAASYAVQVAHGEREPHRALEEARRAAAAPGVHRERRGLLVEARQLEQPGGLGDQRPCSGQRGRLSARSRQASTSASMPAFGAQESRVAGERGRLARMVARPGGYRRAAAAASPQRSSRQASSSWSGRRKRAGAAPSARRMSAATTAASSLDDRRPEGRARERIEPDADEPADERRVPGKHRHRVPLGAGEQLSRVPLRHAFNEHLRHRGPAARRPAGARSGAAPR